MGASRRWVAGALLANALFIALAGGTTALAAAMKLEVGARVPWTNTGVVLNAGDRVTIKASGQASWGGGFYGGPRGFGLTEKPPGIGQACGETQKQAEAGGAPFNAPGLNCYSLLYRLESFGAAHEAGAGVTFTAKLGGELQLGYNDNAYGDDTGSFAAEVTVVPRPVISSAAVAVLDGTARITATVSNAQACSLSSALTKPLAGLPVTFPCSATEAVFRMVVLPTVTATTPVKYPLTLTAKGPGGSATVHLSAVDEPISKGGPVPHLIEGGELDTCTVRLTGGGDVWCWGSAGEGELGDELTNGWINHPSVPARELADVVDITGAGEDNCALIASGRVECLGYGGYGVLGVGEPLPQRAILPDLVHGVSDAVQVVAGQRYACALLLSGRVMCWGTIPSERGQPTGRVIATPAEVPGIAEATEIAAGLNHTCALIKGGTVECWGSNLNGQLGEGYGDEASMTPLRARVEHAVSIAAGGSESCSLIEGGAVECWGRDTEGELGDHGSKPAEENATAVIGLKGAIQVSVGAEDACALLADDTVECWGGNAKGQLGNGTERPTDTPEHVVTASSGILTNAVEIAAAYQHTCALLVGGAVECWGKDNYGEVGNGEFALTVTSASAVTFPQPAASRLLRRCRAHRRHRHHTGCRRRHRSTRTHTRLVTELPAINNGRAAPN
jgi:alpha-tubulin suppressor-like RCC1 family protein